MSIIKPAAAQRNQLRAWGVFEFGIPTFFFILSWVATRIYGDLTMPFFRIFSTADLVMFAALLCLGMYKDIDTAHMNSEFPRNSFWWSKTLAMSLALLFLGAYGGMRVAAMNFSFDPEAPVDIEVIANVYGSIVSALVAFAFCFRVRWHIIKELATLEGK